MRVKECRKCKENKISIDFSKSSRNRDGLGSYCKSCDSKMGKIWYNKNREYKNEKSREWFKENKERFREYQLRWEELNKDSRKIYLVKWYQKNKERASIKHKQWWNDNPHKRKLYKHKYYNKIREQLGEVSTDIIEKLFVKQEGLCYYCQVILDEWHLDHMHPVSKGGFHDDSNLCLSCPSCNLRKQAKTAEEFVKQLEEEKLWQ